MSTTRRLTRRSVLTDLGGGALAVAILGPAIVACGGSGDSDARETTGAAPDDAATDSSAPAAPDTTAAPETTAASSAPDTTAEQEALSEVEPGALAWHEVSLGFVSAYLLVRGDKVALVDTGTAGSAGQIESALTAIDRGWADVGDVILTHLHGDHVGELPTVLERAASATAYAGALDVAGIRSPRPITPVDDGDDVFGMQVIATPGHTAGHISILDPEGSILVAGDALTSGTGGPEGAIERFTRDMTAANESIRKMGALDFDTLLVGHGPPVNGDAANRVADLAASL